MDNCEHLIDAGGPTWSTTSWPLLRACGCWRPAGSRSGIDRRGRSAPLAPLPLPPEDVALPDAPSYPAVQLLARPGRRPCGPTSGSIATTSALRGRDRPPARRPAAGHRAGRGPAAGAAGRRDRRPAVRPVPAADRRQPDRPAPAPDAAGGRRVELGPAVAARARCWPSGSRSSRPVPTPAAPPRSAPTPGSRAARSTALLTALVDKSLLQAESASGRCAEVRYRMLETLREYGIERLAERASWPRPGWPHAAHFAALVARAEPSLRSRGPARRAGAGCGRARQRLWQPCATWRRRRRRRGRSTVALALAWYWPCWRQHGDDRLGGLVLRGQRRVASRPGWRTPGRPWCWPT